MLYVDYGICALLENMLFCRLDLYTGFLLFLVLQHERVKKQGKAKECGYTVYACWQHVK